MSDPDGGMFRFDNPYEHALTEHADSVLQMSADFAQADKSAAHKLNADQTVAVATDVFWNEDMSTCPRGTKCQMLGEGGVAVYGTYNGDPFWIGWCPLPKRRKPTSNTHP